MMQFILLEMSDGLEGAVKLLFAVAFLHLAVSMGMYFYLLHKHKPPFWAALPGLVIGSFTALLILYVNSFITGGEPYTSLLDPYLLGTTGLVSLPAVLILPVLACIRYFRKT